MWRIACLCLCACSFKSQGPDASAPPDVEGVQRIALPFVYQGSVENGEACDTSYATTGYAPVDLDRHPLFLYFVGTNFGDDASATFDSAAPLKVTQTLATRGFVALSAAYDNGAAAWLSDHDHQMRCLFDATREESLVAKACALPNVDCALGIATWGHSQGGYVAVNASRYDARVGAAWATGYGGDGAPTLSKDRYRIMNGENDGQNGTAKKLNAIFGTSCENTDVCFDDAGGGWRIVRAAELATVDGIPPSADHCWFDRRECRDKRLVLDPNWTDGTADFSLGPNADWLRARLR